MRLYNDILGLHILRLVDGNSTAYLMRLEASILLVCTINKPLAAGYQTVTSFKKQTTVPEVPKTYKTYMKAKLSYIG